MIKKIQLSDRQYINNGLVFFIRGIKLKIGNFKRRQAGFTLVELLAVMVVMASIGGIVFGVLFASLRGSSKSTNVTDLQQNGKYALSQMEKMIKFARELESPSPCYSDTSSVATTSSVTIRNHDQGTTTFSCDNVPNGTISSNSASLLDTSAVTVTACSFTCSQKSLYDIPTITISFTLSKKYNSGVVDLDTPASFQSTIILRNLKD